MRDYWQFTEALREKITKAFLKGKMPERFITSLNGELYVKFNGFRIYPDRLTLLNGETEVMQVSLPMDLRDMGGKNVTLLCEKDIVGLNRFKLS